MLAETVAEWREEWKRQGLKEGREEGRVEGETNILLKQLELKFVKLSVEDRNRVQSADSETLLKWGEWMKVIRKDWIKANKQIQMKYPLQYHYGIAPHALIRASLPYIYRLDKELSKAPIRKMARLVEKDFFIKTENREVAAMTANDYFEYCRIAYIAGKRREETADSSLSRREIYARYAKGPGIRRDANHVSGLRPPHSWI